jgi:hypothetical protein
MAKKKTTRVSRTKSGQGKVLKEYATRHHYILPHGYEVKIVKSRKK